MVQLQERHGEFLKVLILDRYTYLYKCTDDLTQNRIYFLSSTSQNPYFRYFHFHLCHALYSTNPISSMDMYSPTSRLLWFTFVVNVQIQKDYLDMGCNCYFRSELAFSFIDVSIFACFFLKGMLLKWMGCHIGGLQYQSYYASNTSLFQPARLGLETFKKRSFLQVIHKNDPKNMNNK